MDSTASVELERVADRTVLEDLVGQLHRPGLDAAAVAIVDPAQRDRPQSRRGLAEDVRSALAGRGIDVAWSVWAEGLRPLAPWVHHDTGHRGLLPDLGPDGTATLRALLSGTLSLPRREAIRAQMLDPGGRANASTVQVQEAGSATSVDGAFVRVANQLLASAEHAAPPGVGELRALAEQLTVDFEQGRGLSLTAWTPNVAIALWQSVVAAADARDRAVPAALLAAAYYLRGDARTARVALGIARDTLPDLPLVRALTDLADQGLPPRSIRALLTSPPS